MRTVFLYTHLIDMTHDSSALQTVEKITWHGVRPTNCLSEVLYIDALRLFSDNASLFCI